MKANFMAAWIWCFFCCFFLYRDVYHYRHMKLAIVYISTLGKKSPMTESNVKSNREAKKQSLSRGRAQTFRSARSLTLLCWTLGSSRLAFLLNRLHHNTVTFSKARLSRHHPDGGLGDFLRHLALALRLWSRVTTNRHTAARRSESLTIIRDEMTTTLELKELQGASCLVGFWF